MVFVLRGALQTASLSFPDPVRGSPEKRPYTAAAIVNTE